MPVPDWIRSDADVCTEEAFDNMLSSHTLLPFGGDMKCGTVTSRMRDADNNLIGKRNNNPLLDNRVYEVEFSDGNIGECTANMIAENIYASVDAEGDSAHTDSANHRPQE